MGIVVPAYNSARYLTELIQSIESATCKPFECVIVNDGSTSNTAHVVTTLTATDSRFTLVSISNAGVANACNVGMNFLSTPVKHVTYHGCR